MDESFQNEQSTTMLGSEVGRGSSFLGEQRIGNIKSTKNGKRTQAKGLPFRSANRAKIRN